MKSKFVTKLLAAVMACSLVAGSVVVAFADEVITDIVAEEGVAAFSDEEVAGNNVDGDIVFVDGVAETPKGTIILVDPNGPVPSKAEIEAAFEAEDEELVGKDPLDTPHYYYLRGESYNSYDVLKGYGDRCYFKFETGGATTYWTHVYLEGNKAFSNRAESNGTETYVWNNVSVATVVHFEYNVSKHTLLTTCQYLKDWKYVDIFPLMTRWEYNAVKYCTDKGLMKGTGDNIFDPKVELTRAMFAEIVYRMAGSPKVTYRAIFNDVPNGQWYSNGIVWAYDKGIVKGIKAGVFDPNGKITREQATALLRRYAQYLGYNTNTNGDLSKFSDSHLVSNWARGDVAWATQYGVMSGSKNGSALFINPKNYASRAECAALIMKFEDKGFKR